MLQCPEYKAGPCATGACEPRQIRKEATVSKTFWVPQVAWPFINPGGDRFQICPQSIDAVI